MELFIRATVDVLKRSLCAKIYDTRFPYQREANVALFMLCPFHCLCIVHAHSISLPLLAIAHEICLNS